MTMRVVCFSNLDDLLPYASDWDRLAGGVPFRSWAWLSCWWKAYGPTAPGSSPKSRLAIFGVFDDVETLIAVAPWYLDSSALHGRVLRPLGSGEVCSDYLGVLCDPHAQEAVIGALTDELLLQSGREAPDSVPWDLIELGCVDSQDHLMSQLANNLAVSGCIVHRRPDMSCWRLNLPVNWDMYVASLSKNQRRDVRRLERELLNTYRVEFHSVQSMDDLPNAMDILLDLHQRRRHMLGEKGCFASERFLAFYREVVPALMRTGQLEFCWITLDGRPVAVEYQLAGDGVLYDYQTGVDPDAMKHQPGKLLNLAAIRRAIERGYRAFDFLRGDESYKARLGARPRPTIEYRVVPRRPVAQIRHGIWLAGHELKAWVKEAMKDVP
jgi:CelD/BcsL family acetyltransferase involved in cellulose biosynthesis